jgi:ABC-type lipoprotein export system ATPase subunit
VTARQIDIERSVAVSESGRARQLETLFDIPFAERSHVEWHGEVDFDAQPWAVGLIVGPSGVGKSTVLREVFGEPDVFDWPGASVVDDFADQFSMEEISAACQAVGFNTIPSWLRPYEVLSNGERFRVDLARRMIEAGDPIVVDEFTSVVDRQVAKIGAYAVAKYVRKNGRRLVAATCHYDVVDWLQPDWVFEPATMTLTWRSVQPRPRVECTIRPVPRSAWTLFRRYHYLTASLHFSAKSFVLFAEGQPAAFAAIVKRPHPTSKGLWAFTRWVTLPDWQGLGLIFVLTEYIGAAFKARGLRINTYPAHPALIRSCDRSPNWAMVGKPGVFNLNKASTLDTGWRQGTRPNATFQYVGPAITREESDHLLNCFIKVPS